MGPRHSTEPTGAPRDWRSAAVTLIHVHGVMNDVFWPIGLMSAFRPFATVERTSREVGDVPFATIRYIRVK
jgi:hypothetical protein